MQEFLKERGEYQRNCFVEIDKVKIHFENIWWMCRVCAF